MINFGVVGCWIELYLILVMKFDECNLVLNVFYEDIIFNSVVGIEFVVFVKSVKDDFCIIKRIYMMIDC